MADSSKADWKLFQERVPLWQERYMEKLTKEYIKLLSGPGDASEHFWKLEARINKDKKSPGVTLVMDKNEMHLNLAIMIKRKVITWKDLEGFSEGAIERVKNFLS